MNLSDMARYGEALDALERSVDRAMSGGSPRQAAWSGSLVGRIHLLRGEPDRAATALEQVMDLVRAEKWMAFAPWPQSLRAEVDRTVGDVDRAADGYAHAFALACQLGDPCWEGVAARGSGLLEADAGDVPAALGWLEDARDALHAVARRLPVDPRLRPRRRCPGRRWPPRTRRAASWVDAADRRRRARRDARVRGPVLRLPGPARSPRRGRGRRRGCPSGLENPVVERPRRRPLTAVGRAVRIGRSFTRSVTRRPVGCRSCAAPSGGRVQGGPA